MASKRRSILGTFRRGLVWALAAGVAIYVIFAIFAGGREVMAELRRFDWIWVLPILLLSLGNYLVRFARWEYYLRVLRIRIPTWTSLSVFMAGLAMTITPGKVGEFLKSYLLKETDRIPMTRSAPVVFMERVTDLLALVLLASVGVGTYYEKGVWILVGAGAAMVVGVLVLQSRPLCRALLRPLRRVPKLGKIAAGLDESLLAAHELTRPLPIALGLLLGVAGWACECLGLHLTFVGFREAVPLGASFFVYAFSTIAGVVSPGGLGATDLSLVGFAVAISDGLEESTAVAAAFLIRTATLWFAVGVGALFLLRFARPLQVDVETARASGEPGAKENEPSEGT